MSLDFVSNEEIVQEARRHVDQGTWDYLVGGSESETTLRRNRLAFDRIAFRPRILVDVSFIDPSTTFLGQKLRIPAILAPIGSLQVFHPEAGAASTRAATDFGILHAISSVTQPTLEETAAATATPKIFQLYVHGDKKWTEDIIGRVKEAGYAALALMVDVAHYSRRERPMLTRYQPPTRRLPPNRTYQASLTSPPKTLDKLSPSGDFRQVPTLSSRCLAPQIAAMRSVSPVISLCRPSTSTPSGSFITSTSATLSASRSEPYIMSTRFPNPSKPTTR